MNDPPTLRLRFDTPRDGWIRLQLEAGGQVVDVSFSYVPCDTMLDLAEAADAIVAGESHRRVVMHEEPAELEFDLNRKGEGETTLALTRFADHRRAEGGGEAVLKLRVPAVVFGRAVWRALRDLEGRCSADDFERQWRRPFPARAVQLLGARIRSGHDRGAGEQTDAADEAQS